MTEPFYSEERAALAAEFALGLLSHSEYAQAIHLLATDADFRTEVASWEREIDAWLTEGSAGVEPPNASWERLSASVARPPVIPLRTVSQSSHLLSWRVATLAASVAAVAFASLWFASSSHSPDMPRPPSGSALLDNLSVAQILGTGDRQLVTAIFERSSGRLIARVSPLGTRGGVPELWLIGADGKPRSLGVGIAGSVVTITLSSQAQRAFIDGATIAVSIEPNATGSHVSPQGPVLGTAKISEI